MRKTETSDAIDRLYAAPLEGFVPLRTALANELRASDPAAARLVAGAPKPTRTAWALNQVARREPSLLSALFESRDEAAKAQKRGDAARMLEASRLYRDALNAVVHAARAVLSSAGVEMSTAQARRMAETLQAMAAEPGSHRAQLVAGRLVRDVPIEDPFAGLEPGPRTAKTPVAQTDRGGEDAIRKAHANEQRRRAEEEARAQRKAQAELEAARSRVAALEEEAREARAAARQAENEAARAQAAAERARAKASDVEDRLRRAKEALRSSS
jgi:hypothetical protein